MKFLKWLPSFVMAALALVLFANHELEAGLLSLILARLWMMGCDGAGEKEE
ncbi:MAG: hypothetical protein IMZ71_01165 [Chloroflexi bacterium]|nr:hypothetical protein [Chloroflexota bacterium]